MTRRAVLLGAAALVSACTASGSDREAPRASSSGSAAASGPVLVAYFSRAGENYYYGGRRNLTVGNTQVVADLISGFVDCDVHRIEAEDPYPSAYDPTVARNVREQNADARPAIANPLTSIEKYRTVLLGSPIWNIRAPMIMTTFTEGLDFTGKTVHPFTTHAMSGLGNTERDYAASCRGATLGEGLAVQGEKAAEGGPDIEAWLRRIALLPG
ncbi:flavodoxin [Cryptosporangium aurantiacum]|uniref:flavodoxin n=1 Tax=Cryptosporangium aurantiacum TaxID=134849 RepID=UPI0009FF764E